MKPGQDRISSRLSTDWDPDFIPAPGEICLDLETGKYRYGDGVTRHADLPLSVAGFLTHDEASDFVRRKEADSFVTTNQLTGVLLTKADADKIEQLEARVSAIETKTADPIPVDPVPEEVKP